MLMQATLKIVRPYNSDGGTAEKSVETAARDTLPVSCYYEYGMQKFQGF
jgi:hypothetical protein